MGRMVIDRKTTCEEKNRAFVLAQYFGYRRRDSNWTPDFDLPATITG
jgi:hypothetical protein